MRGFTVVELIIVVILASVVSAAILVRAPSPAVKDLDLARSRAAAMTMAKARARMAYPSSLPNWPGSPSACYALLKPFLEGETSEWDKFTVPNITYVMGNSWEDAVTTSPP